MKGDFTRRTFRPEKHYSSVRMQQGRVQIDADWNELVEILQRFARQQAIDTFGATGVPSATPDAFRIEPVESADSQLVSFKIHPGRMYVDGVLVELDELIDFTQQPDFPGAKLDARQPFLVYLDVWERHISALEDPDIVEVALGGPDTGTRTQIVGQVKVLPLESADLIAGIDLDQEFRVSPPPDVEPDPDEPIPPVNQLYRVEIHEGSTGNAGFGSTFKWSRDNGSVVALWTGVTDDGSKVKVDVDGLGRARFRKGQFIELTDDSHELRREPGELRKIDEIEELPGIQRLTLGGAYAGLSARLSEFTDENTQGRRKKARLWDSDLLTINGPAVSLPGGGVKVQFSEGRYTTGDAWLIPIRRGNIQSPAVPAEGEHHYAKLAIVNVQSLVTDVRIRFSTIPQLEPSVVPAGVIVMWSGDESDIPAGWVLCAGGVTRTGRTIPDLRGRFILGAGSGLKFSAASHVTGDPDRHRIDGIKQLETTSITHHHVLAQLREFIQVQRGDNPNERALTLIHFNPIAADVVERTADETHSHFVAIDGEKLPIISTSGENRPRFYALCYIMKE